MRTLRCKCGDKVVWTGMGQPACDTCEKCGSVPAGHPDRHPDPIPHDFVKQYDHNTGEPFLLCRHCGWREFGATVSDDAETTYPCAVCGKPRTREEGGTVFTVCDKCWDKSEEANR